MVLDVLNVIIYIILTIHILGITRLGKKIMKIYMKNIVFKI